MFILGALYLFWKRRDLFWFFGIGWVLCGPLFLFYSAFPVLESFTKGVSERFVLTSYLFVAIFISFGVQAVLKLLKWVFFGRVIRKLRLFNLIGLTFLLFPASMAIVNWDKADLSGYQIGGIFVHDILSSANPPGVIIPGGDTESFNMQVAYFVEGQGKGSAIINLGRLAYPWYRKTFMAKYPQYIYPMVSLLLKQLRL